MENFDIYTSLEEAKVEAWRRWNDLELRKKVEEYLGGDIPEPLRNGPRAIMFRNIASPDLECQHFIKIAKEAGLSPVIFEYTWDKFCTNNDDKLCFGRLAIFEKIGRTGKPVISYKKIIDFEKHNGKKFCDITTIKGQNLVEFHHSLFENLGINDVEFFDMSEWLYRNGTISKEYYKKIMSLLICHGTLFENFTNIGEESHFTNDIFLPSFNAIKDTFLKEPLISPVIPLNEIEDPQWWCHSSEIISYV